VAFLSFPKPILFMGLVVIIPLFSHGSKESSPHASLRERLAIKSIENCHWRRAAYIAHVFRKKDPEFSAMIRLSILQEKQALKAGGRSTQLNKGGSEPQDGDGETVQWEADSEIWFDEAEDKGARCILKADPQHRLKFDPALLPFDRVTSILKPFLNRIPELGKRLRHLVMNWVYYSFRQNKVSQETKSGLAQGWLTGQPVLGSRSESCRWRSLGYLIHPHSNLKAYLSHLKSCGDEKSHPILISQWRQAGDLAVKLHRWKIAYEYYEKVNSLAPNTVEYRLWLATLQAFPLAHSNSLLTLVGVATDDPSFEKLTEQERAALRRALCLRVENSTRSAYLNFIGALAAKQDSENSIFMQIRMGLTVARSCNLSTQIRQLEILSQLTNEEKRRTARLLAHNLKRPQKKPRKKSRMKLSSNGRSDHRLRKRQGRRLQRKLKKINEIHFKILSFRLQGLVLGHHMSDQKRDKKLGLGVEKNVISRLARLSGTLSEGKNRSFWRTLNLIERHPGKTGIAKKYASFYRKYKARWTDYDSEQLLRLERISKRVEKREARLISRGKEVPVEVVSSGLISVSVSNSLQTAAQPTDGCLRFFEYLSFSSEKGSCFL